MQSDCYGRPKESRPNTHHILAKHRHMGSDVTRISMQGPREFRNLMQKPLLLHGALKESYDIADVEPGCS